LEVSGDLAYDAQVVGCCLLGKAGAYSLTSWRGSRMKPRWYGND